MVGAPADTRPSPDALLEAAERERRGKHKIFLGAAPGVGKTYEMLSAARRRKADGIDVVVGVAETHRRAETEAQLAGLEVVPRRVRETVPDRVVDAADEVELVDLTPADLMARLREGKVYVREQAQRALRHYFSPGNLTALRELALRRTAERVDDQMLSYMREHAITGPWAAGERVVVCLDPSPGAANAVRAAKRTADGLDAELIALYVETDRHATLSEAEHTRLAETMRLGAELGAEVVTVPGRRVLCEVLDVSRSR